MTGRNLIQRMMRGEQADRVGLMDGPWQDTIAAWVQQGYPTRMAYKEIGEQRWRREDGRWLEAEAAGEYEEPVPPWLHFGYDLAGVGPWFDILPLRDVDELEEETEEWDIRPNLGLPPMGQSCIRVAMANKGTVLVTGGCRFHGIARDGLFG